jgi:hypothetical protein
VLIYAPQLKLIREGDPNIHKMAILADVAPYSREYNTYRQIVGKEAAGNPNSKSNTRRSSTG